MPPTNGDQYFPNFFPIQSFEPEWSTFFFVIQLVHRNDSLTLLQNSNCDDLSNRIKITKTKASKPNSLLLYDERPEMKIRHPFCFMADTRKEICTKSCVRPLNIDPANHWARQCARGDVRDRIKTEQKSSTAITHPELTCQNHASQVVVLLIGKSTQNLYAHEKGL